MTSFWAKRTDLFLTICLLPTKSNFLQTKRSAQKKVKCQ